MNTNKPVRFKSLAIGQMFTMCCGGQQILCQKTSEGSLKAKKLNDPGFVTVKIDPELNEDDMWPSHQVFLSQ